MNITKSFLITAAAVIGLSYVPGLWAQEHRDDDRDRAADQRRDDEHARVEYHFRQEDGVRLREHYRHIERVDVSHRVALVAGGRLPGDWHRLMRPVPAVVIRELAPPPPGYVFGYIDGYCVVYDPRTGMIADVIDLSSLPR